jgi:citrate lyase beta subunit
MKQIGYLLLAGGFVVAAYATALDTVATNWNLFVPAALAGMAGVFSIKRHERGEARSEQVLTANRAELNESLGNIVSNLEQLNEAGAAISTEDLRAEVDSRLRDDLRRFADARESMVHLFGLQAYANVMSDFAAGERYVNRVWSASADGYDGEARRFLGKAEAQFRAASQQLETAAKT